MDYSKLKLLNISELTSIAKQMDIYDDTRSRESRNSDRFKSTLIRRIAKGLREYEEYKQEKIDKYKKLERIGGDGKEGKTFVVKNRRGHKYAMKTFPKSKSSKTLKRELEFQQRASKHGLSPKIRDYDTVSKYIVMDLLDKNLLEILQEQNGVLTLTQQKHIINLFKGLDKINIFHRDPNPLNIMTKNGNWYIIDYGFAVEITDKLKKKYDSEDLNLHFMTTGLLLKLKELCAEASFSYMEQCLTKSIS